MNTNRVGDVVAPLVADPEGDVVGERPPEMLDRRPDPRRLGVDDRRRRPVDIDDVRRPAALHEVGEIHDVVGMEVGDEDRLEQRPVRAESFVDGQARPPQLAVHPFATVDEVHGIADDDRVGVPAPSNLGVGAATRSEQDKARRARQVP